MNFTVMSPKHGQGNEIADRDRAVGTVTMRPTTGPDAPTKTVTTRGRNHPVFSICTRSLSSGDVHIAWVYRRPLKPTHTAPRGALLESAIFMRKINKIDFLALYVTVNSADRNLYGF